MHNCYNCERQSTGLKNSEQNDQLTMLELSRGFLVPALDITVQDPAICFKWLRF